jgi:DNA-binding transcriptional LysR family regulator
VPQEPDDLTGHDCLAFNFRRAEEGWPFRFGDAVRRRAVRGPVTAGDGETLRSLALAGVGLARLAGFHVREDIAGGQLIPVLEPYNPGDREPVHVLFPGVGVMPSRVRVFIDHLAERSARL